MILQIIVSRIFFFFTLLRCTILAIVVRFRPTIFAISEYDLPALCLRRTNWRMSILVSFLLRTFFGAPGQKFILICNIIHFGFLFMHYTVSIYLYCVQQIRVDASHALYDDFNESGFSNYSVFLCSIRLRSKVLWFILCSYDLYIICTY